MIRACAALLTLATAAAAENDLDIPDKVPGDIRLAVYNADLSRRGPGLLLRDIRDGKPEVLAIARVIASARPDVLLLGEFDYDLDGVALTAFAEVLSGQGHDMPYAFAAEPNSGLDSGQDFDGDGRGREPEDAQGYGWFSGDGGLAILSTLPIEVDRVQDYSDLLWQKLPDAQLPDLDDPEATIALSFQRLSTKAHWVVPVRLPDGGALNVLAFGASPPVFDGPEDRNGRRNADEIRFWQLWLDGALGEVPEGPVAVMGNANLDPFDGDGRKDAIAALLADPRLQDAAPRSVGGALINDPDHTGDPALDTVDWPDGAPGNLRVSYVLPDARLTVSGAGVVWPGPDNPAWTDLSEHLGAHRLVWVDIRR